MRIYLHKRFSKALLKLNSSDQLKVKNRLVVFAQDPFDPILRNHLLKGFFAGFRSIDIGPDLRAVYKTLDAKSVMFRYLGTHSQLY